MNELALFAGAGGGILGGHLLGWRTVCAVEFDPYAASVLVARQNDGVFPPFPVWNDVRTFDGRPWRGLVDVVSGGFPCQEISAAGTGTGIAGGGVEVACGAKWPASSVRFDRTSSSWKTAHCLWEEDLPSSSVILPKWGSMQSGAVFRHPTAERPISGIVSGLWPTPTVCGNYNRKGVSPTSGDGLATAVRKYPKPTASASASKGWAPNHNRASTDDRLDYTVERESFQPGQQTPPMRLNPDWVEWLMGWPLGWTDLKPLAMDRFRAWRLQHSPF